MLPDSDAVWSYPQPGVPSDAVLNPLLVTLLVLSGHDEILDLHGFELPGAEDEVAGGDLVSESLAYLSDAEREPLACCGVNVVEVDEDALRGFGTQVRLGCLLLDRPDERLEHEVELSGLGKLAAAVRARGTLQVVFSEAVVARLALDERVGEAGDMAARAPDVGVHENGGV